MKRTLKAILIGLAVLALAVGGVGIYMHRRALPLVDGEVITSGVSAPARVIRDAWGVPHVFAETELDGYYALGWATAQDRLFHIAMLNQAVQGRLAEWFGEPGIEIDRMFRTLDLQGVGKRLYAEASAEARAALDAYQRGVNDYAATKGGGLPIEFALLRASFEPLQPGDLVGVLGFMSWGLHDAWRFEPVFERLRNTVGDRRARELFPYGDGGAPAVHFKGKLTGSVPPPELFDLSPESLVLLALLPQVPASNNWAISPKKSATGHALLANDPHLGHAHPPVWYEAHLKAGTLDVAGVTIPGLPLVVIGHNRDIAWGFTNLMVDAGDFFIERIHPDDPKLVMHDGEWLPIKTEEGEILVRGGERIPFTRRVTPHGPIVSGPGMKAVVKDGTEAINAVVDGKAAEGKAEEGDTEAAKPTEFPVLSYQWLYWTTGGDLDALYRLNRARNWQEFRAAARGFSAITQNSAYADREGHIAMQTIGKIPLRKGGRDGTRYRIGWDGSQEWTGYVPFEQLPVTLDPERGWVASANNPPLPGPAPYHVSIHYEPLDRITRIHELLNAKDKLSVDDMRAMHADTVWESAVRLRPRILAAYEGQRAPEGNLAAALEALRGWDGDMRADSAAAAVMGVFYEHLFRETFEDDFGPGLTRDLRGLENQAGAMLWSVYEEGRRSWIDRADTPEAEDAAAIFRRAMAGAIAELEQRLGGDARGWEWGDLHQLEFGHALGRVKWLAPYFNVGPFPVPGHSNTVNKMQFRDDTYRVYHGPSMRQITDFSNLDASLSVLPTGQSGVRASPHYADQAPLWLSGEYHPLRMDRDMIEAEAKATLVLRPPGTEKE